MNVLVVGNGGREHALAWKLRQSPRVKDLFVAPGNAGTALAATNLEIAPNEIEKLVAFAKQNAIELTVIGPEAPLVSGVVNAFQQENLRVFGPAKQAAELEGSKVFCKNLLRKADVPTADYRAFKDPQAALTYLKDRDEAPLVVKADGLAAGKGVVVCVNKEQALAAVKRIALDKEFGSAGNQLVIEERLDGVEVSVLAITDGHTVLPLPPAQDHKAAFDNDQGPNTGGMGAYSPAPIMDDKLLSKVHGEILVPVIHAMKRSRRPFRGVLYAGLMLTRQGPKVLEFNVRFGDPECQPILMRLQTDLLDILEATADGKLEELSDVTWDPRPAICVVMASEGYPGRYESGLPIRGLEEAAQVPDVQVFQAGTTLKNGQTLTSGGRVLGVTALGETLAKAKLQAYTAVKLIRWSGAWCRSDIGDKALGITG